MYMQGHRNNHLYHIYTLITTYSKLISPLLKVGMYQDTTSCINMQYFGPIKMKLAYTYLVHTSKGAQNQYFFAVLTIRVGLCYVYDLYTGTCRMSGVLAMQECVLNQILTIRVGLCT